MVRVPPLLPWLFGYHAPTTWHRRVANWDSVLEGVMSLVVRQGTTTEGHHQTGTAALPVAHPENMVVVTASGVPQAAGPLGTLAVTGTGRRGTMETGVRVGSAVATGIAETEEWIGSGSVAAIGTSGRGRYHQAAGEGVGCLLWSGGCLVACCVACLRVVQCQWGWDLWFATLQQAKSRADFACCTLMHVAHACAYSHVLL